MLDEQDIHFRHHVHRLQQVLAVVAMFIEERIETMMDVILEIAMRRHLRQNLLDDVLVVVQNLLQRVRTEMIVRQQVDEFTEGKTS